MPPTWTSRPARQPQLPLFPSPTPTRPGRTPPQRPTHCLADRRCRLRLASPWKRRALSLFLAHSANNAHSIFTCVGIEPRLTLGQTLMVGSQERPLAHGVFDLGYLQILRLSLVMSALSLSLSLSLSPSLSYPAFVEWPARRQTAAETTSFDAPPPPPLRCCCLRTPGR